MYKKAFMLFSAAVFAAAASGCGAKSYKDGTYHARSAEYVDNEADEAGNGYGEVDITISGGKITACEFKTYELDGTFKDDEYGKENGEVMNKDFYNKAQKANAARDNYSQQLVAKGDIDEVDAISGATLNYNEFTEAVRDALRQAEE
ncbi:MAG: FMN-binding protein [Ruminococcus sp.]|nr:FMN-binding protein [Ruminococcus sp.]